MLLTIIAAITSTSQMTRLRYTWVKKYRGSAVNGNKSISGNGSRKELLAQYTICLAHQESQEKRISHTFMLCIVQSHDAWVAILLNLNELNERLQNISESTLFPGFFLFFCFNRGCAPGTYFQFVEKCTSWAF